MCIIEGFYSSFKLEKYYVVWFPTGFRMLLCVQIHCLFSY
uniref:Uncharacterized protein n=1 Tax=Moniliophthora roreri TaxID=221103 RepID=A0A0W0FUD7_MONRR